jgi:hypothetical protein
MRDADAPEISLAWLAVHDRSVDDKAVPVKERHVACAGARHSPHDFVNDVLERQLVERTAHSLTHHLPVSSSSSVRHADTVACYSDVADLPACSSGFRFSVSAGAAPFLATERVLALFECPGVQAPYFLPAPEEFARYRRGVSARTGAKRSRPGGRAAEGVPEAGSARRLPDPPTADSGPNRRRALLKSAPRLAFRGSRGGRCD